MTAKLGGVRHLRRLLPYLSRHRRRLALGLLCLAAGTTFALVSPLILRHAIDDLARDVTRAKLQFYSSLIVGAALIQGLFAYFTRTIVLGTSREIECELRSDVFAHLTRLSAGYYQRQRVGDLMTRATNDVEAVQAVVGGGILHAADTVATSLGALTLMCRISPLLVGLALVPLLVVAVLVRYVGRKVHALFQAVQSQLANVNAIAQENFSSVRVVRAYAQQCHERERFERANRELLRRSESLIRLSASFYPGMWFIGGSGGVLVLWLAGIMVVHGTITLGQLVAFGAYVGMLQVPMMGVGWVVNILERGAASMGRLAEILETEPDVADEAQPEPVEAVRGDVELRDLTFSFEGQPVLKGISLKVPAGTSLALIGPTGCGKSTLMGLLARVLDPPPGTVFVDGCDVRRMPLAVLREAIGFVPQESLLFLDTVRENVAFGLPSDSPDRELRAERAAELAQLAKDVRDFPARYETVVGERGITLSGGQGQRTALARALAKDPPILILDDALSSVDTETEEQILRGLRVFMAARTTLLVSHRVSTVKAADCIAVLHEGQLVAQGTHEELVAQGGFYADLDRRQRLEDEMKATT